MNTLTTKVIMREFIFIVHKNTLSNNLYDQVAVGNGSYLEKDFETYFDVFINQLYGLALPTDNCARPKAKRALEFAACIVASWCNPLCPRPTLLKDAHLSPRPNKKARFIKTCDLAFRSWHTQQTKQYQLYMIMAGHYSCKSFVIKIT